MEIGNKVFEGIDVNAINAPAAVRTAAVAIRAQLGEGKISLDARQPHRFDVFFLRKGQLEARYLTWLPMVFHKNGSLSPKWYERGWLGQTGVYEYECLDCKSREGTGVPTATEKLIPSINVYMAEKGIEPLSCKLCGSLAVERKRNENGGLLPQAHPTPHEGLDEQLKSMVGGQPAVDVVPALFGLFKEDEVPGVWEPGTPLESELAGRAAEKGWKALPYRMFHGMNVPQLKQLLLLCRPYAAGPVAEADLYKDGRAAEDPLNPRIMQQILLGEPARRINGF